MFRALNAVIDGYNFLKGLPTQHTKKTALSLTACGAVLGYLNASKLVPIAEAVQAEGQSLLLRHASRDMSCVPSVVEGNYVVY